MAYILIKIVEKRKIIFLFIVFLLFQSCTSWDMIIHPSNYQKRNYATEKIFVHDTINVYFNSEGKILRGPIAGFRPNKQLTFSKIGDRITVSKYDKIELISDGIDFNNSSISIYSKENSDSLIIAIVDKFHEDYVFTDKCQCYTIYEVNEIPPIKVSANLDIHQIVITPIYNNTKECKHLGYQIRYGDQKFGGCWKEAKTVYNIFKKCVKGKNIKIRHRKSYPDNLDEILFGK